MGIDKLGQHSLATTIRSDSAPTSAESTGVTASPFKMSSTGGTDSVTLQSGMPQVEQSNSPSTQPKDPNYSYIKVDGKELKVPWMHPYLLPGEELQEPNIDVKKDGNKITATFRYAKKDMSTCKLGSTYNPCNGWEKITFQFPAKDIKTQQEAETFVKQQLAPEMTKVLKETYEQKGHAQAVKTAVQDVAKTNDAYRNAELEIAKVTGSSALDIKEQEDKLAKMKKLERTPAEIASVEVKIQQIKQDRDAKLATLNQQRDILFKEYNDADQKLQDVHNQFEKDLNASILALNVNEKKSKVSKSTLLIPPLAAIIYAKSGGGGNWSVSTGPDDQPIKQPGSK